MDPAVLREDMVDGLEHALGGLPERVGTAMRTVPRHEFVSERPYDNRDAEHAGTRVLAPRTVARLLSALAPEPGDDTLVVGAGVGYTAAVAAELVGARRVHAVDISRRVVLDARSNLARAGYDAVLVDCRDGAEGLPEYAPFDRVLVEAAAIEPPRRLVDQVAPGGRLVMPRGGPEQTLVAVRPRDGDRNRDPDPDRNRNRNRNRDAVSDHADSSPAGDARTNGSRGRGDEGDRRAGRGGRPDYEVIEEFGPVGFAPMLVDGEQAGRTPRNRTEREDRQFAEQGYFARKGWEYEWIDWDERLDSGRGHRRRR